MIRRTYQCLDCEQEFVVECNADDGDPICPNPDCNKVLDWRPTSFAIGGSIEGKAVAHTQQILEQDYGLSNFKDNAQQGESGIIRRQETKVESEMVEREFREQMAQVSPEKQQAFWGGANGAPTSLTSMTGQSLIAMAKAGPQGVDPLQALHKRARESGASSHPAAMVKEGFRADFANPARKPKGA